MSTLSATSITFSDATSISSYYSTYPSGAKTVFQASSAPTGWTQDTSSTINDRMMRVVTTGGGTASSTGSAMSQVFSSSSPFSGNVSMTVSGLSVQSTTLTTSQIPSHSHGGNGGGSFGQNSNIKSPAQPANYINPGGNATTSTGGSGSHNHPISYTSASGPFSGTVNFAVNYYNCILCSLN